VLGALLACEEDAEPTYEQYNADDESVAIEVGADEELADVATSLHSSTGEVEIGAATVGPGGGPIGTLHTVIVEVFDEYASDIARASVRTASGDRGEDEYDLDADSTGEGIWKIEIQSVGEEGEVREDTLTFRLWKEVVEEDDGG